MRRRLLVGAALSLLLVLVAAGCDPLLTPDGAAPLRYRDQIFSAVTKTSDIVYGHAVDQDGVNQTLLLDMYRPAGDTLSARPAIVWVHGGSFAFGSKTSSELVDEATTFAKEGYVNVSINYRLDSAGGCTASNNQQRCLTAIAQARDDAKTAVRFLREQAATYHIDANRIAIGGSSAGAITALNVGYTPELASPGEHQGFSSAVRAAQSLSGAELASGGTIDAGDAPAVLFHGTADNLVPYSWAQSTVQRATDAGLLAVLVTFDGEGHVPYSNHRQEILDDTRNFFYWQLDLRNAPQ